MLLSGCLRYQVDLSVSSDQRVSGTVVFAIKTTDAGLAGSTAGIPSDLRDKVTSEPYRQDGYLGEKVTLHQLTFDEVGRLFDSASRARGATPGAGPSASPSATPSVSPTGSPAGSPGPAPGATPSSSTSTGSAAGLPPNHSTFSFRREGNRVHVQGETTFPFFEFGGAGKNFDARIALTFPGDVISANGRQEGRTVTWVVSPDKPTRVEVVAELSDTAPAWVMWALAGGGGLVVLILVLGAVSLLRRRRAAVPAGAAPVFDAAEFQTFLDERSWYPPDMPLPGGSAGPQAPGGYPHGPPPPPAPPPPPQAPPPPPWLGQYPQPGQSVHPQQPPPGYGPPHGWSPPPVPQQPPPGEPPWPADQPENPGPPRRPDDPWQGSPEWHSPHPESPQP